MIIPSSVILHRETGISGYLDWDTAAEDARAEIESLHGRMRPITALDTCLKGYDMVLQNGVSGNEGAMRAYLAFIGPRLAEMHRVLTPTGSLYLHCDPTASHYLKGVMDTIFGTEHFRNEIVWGYKGPSRTQSWFPRKHDIIFVLPEKPRMLSLIPMGARVVSHRATHTEIKQKKALRLTVENSWRIIGWISPVQGICQHMNVSPISRRNRVPSTSA